jgi:hypothetical protein
MTNKLLAVLFIVVAAFSATACEKKGPAEKAGERIDEAYTEALEKAEEAGEKMEKAGDKIEEALQEVEETAEGK